MFLLLLLVMISTIKRNNKNKYTFKTQMKPAQAQSKFAKKPPGIKPIQ